LLCLTKLNAEESFRRKKKKRNKEGRNERKREKEKKEKSLRQNKKPFVVLAHIQHEPRPP
jgi:hypothetical protein